MWTATILVLHRYNLNTNNSENLVVIVRYKRKRCERKKVTVPQETFHLLRFPLSPARNNLVLKLYLFFSPNPIHTTFKQQQPKRTISTTSLRKIKKKAQYTRFAFPLFSLLFEVILTKDYGSLRNPTAIINNIKLICC